MSHWAETGRCGKEPIHPKKRDRVEQVVSDTAIEIHIPSTTKKGGHYEKNTQK
jgi:hypothetical protein